MPDSNHTSGWRWTIGILLVIQMGIIGWLVNRVDDIELRLAAADATITRQLLDERTLTFSQAVAMNRADIATLRLELNRIDKASDRHEQRLEHLQNFCCFNKAGG